MTPDKYAALIQDALDKMMALVSAQADPPLDRGDCAMMLEAALGVVVPAIREDERDNAWQPIETAPKDGTKVLLYCPLPESEYQVVGLWLVSPQIWVECYEHDDVFDPSHWQPLPALPIRSQPEPPK